MSLPPFPSPLQAHTDTCHAAQETLHLDAHCLSPATLPLREFHIRKAQMRKQKQRAISRESCRVREKVKSTGAMMTPGALTANAMRASCSAALYFYEVPSPPRPPPSPPHPQKL